MDPTEEAQLKLKAQAFDDIHGQIKTMLKRSDKYKGWAEAEKNFRDGEIHARVSSVLRELDRLATAFSQQTTYTPQ